MALNFGQIGQAVTQHKYLKLLISGASGSGKTFGSLLIAKGLSSNGKVLALDTEGGRMDLKARDASLNGFTWERLNIDPEKVTSQDYIEFISYAQREKYDVVILDSVTHEWEYCMTQWNRKGGKWGVQYNESVEPHKQFVKAMLKAGIHIVMTCRADMATEQQTDEATGKKTVVTLGLKEQQHRNFPYDVDFLFRINNRDHYTIAEKTEGGLFPDVFKITEETGVILRDFLSGGETAEDSKRRDCLHRISTIHDSMIGLSLLTSEAEAAKMEELRAAPLDDVIAYGKSVKKVLDENQNQQLTTKVK